MWESQEGNLFTHSSVCESERACVCVCDSVSLSVRVCVSESVCVSEPTRESR